MNNINAKDLVTDGTSIWMVDDQTLDRVYKYKVDGTYVDRWSIDPANGSPTGITLDPANPRHLWIVDNGTDRVYQYNDAVSRTSSGSASIPASTSYALAAGNTNPQGIADPPPGAVDGDLVELTIEPLLARQLGCECRAAPRPRIPAAGEGRPTRRAGSRDRRRLARGRRARLPADRR